MTPRRGSGEGLTTRARTLRLLSALALLACVVLALAALLPRRAGAEAPPSREPSARGPAARVRITSAAAPAASAPTSDAPGDETPASFGSAVLEGSGGVPMQKRGDFRSPFANPGWEGPVANVKVGLLLTRLHSYDIKEGTYSADFQLSLVSDRPMPAMNLAVQNGNADDIEVLAATPTFKLYRIKGTFFSPVDLHDYPFDTQELRIELEDEAAGVDQLRLVPDQEHTHLDVDFQVPGWDVAYEEARTKLHYYPDRFEGDDLYYSQYVYKLGIRRFATSAAFTVYVPAVVIVLISLMGLWLPRSLLEVRANAGAPMLAAAVLFHFALMQELPATGYLTRADKMMVAVYVSLCLNMLSSWAWFVLPPKYEDQIFRLGRALVPPVTVVIMLIGAFA